MPRPTFSERELKAFILPMVTYARRLPKRIKCLAVVSNANETATWGNRVVPIQVGDHYTYSPSLGLSMAPLRVRKLIQHDCERDNICIQYAVPHISTVEWMCDVILTGLAPSTRIVRVYGTVLRVAMLPFGTEALADPRLQALGRENLKALQELLYYIYEQYQVDIQMMEIHIQGSRAPLRALTRPVDNSDEHRYRPTTSRRYHGRERSERRRRRDGSPRRRRASRSSSSPRRKSKKCKRRCSSSSEESD